MDTHLQESGGLQRTAPVQSPVPVGTGLSVLQRAVVAVFLALLTLTYLAQLIPPVRGSSTAAPPSSPAGAP